MMSSSGWQSSNSSHPTHPIHSPDMIERSESPHSLASCLNSDQDINGGEIAFDKTRPKKDTSRKRMLENKDDQLSSFSLSSSCTYFLASVRAIERHAEFALVQLDLVKLTQLEHLVTKEIVRDKKRKNRWKLTCFSILSSLKLKSFFHFTSLVRLVSSLYFVFFFFCFFFLTSSIPAPVLHDTANCFAKWNPRFCKFKRVVISRKMDEMSEREERWWETLLVQLLFNFSSS